MQRIALLIVLGALLAAAKCVLCFWLLRALAGGKLLGSRKWLWWTLTVVTPLWATLVPGRPFELIWGSVACVICGCIAIAGIGSWRPTAEEATSEARSSEVPAARPKQKVAPRRPAASSSAQPDAAGSPRPVSRRKQAPRTQRPLPQAQS